MSKFITLLLQGKIHKQISLKPYYSKFLMESHVSQQKSAFFWKVSLLHSLLQMHFREVRMGKWISCNLPSHSSRCHRIFQGKQHAPFGQWAVNSNQQVIVGDSKSFKTNLNAAMTDNVLHENLFEARCSCIEFCNCLSRLNKLPLLSSDTCQLF